ncbi:Cysteine desulfurase, SufS subfamily [Arcticibacter svalbardensis MN12-7]|uniref:Cysteine desulfurase n=1 Tax=Arcticibacter svalbardensis MN12-7 TaxID=1150600 RepID=R9GVQ9_9SPHI|nr:cysteine desulfurase [Arcticibacter svalbardensis]EOR95743.1 Cysteine desulfurase, SufS subfamily [Arcticibacter svalbardensis MN12-7]
MEAITDQLETAFIYRGEPIRNQFPALHQSVYGKPLVYFDNAATTQKPNAVIEAITAYYSTINSNIHRGVHYLSQEATEAYEVTRNSVAAFINAPHAYEVIFTKGTTDGINLIADTFGYSYLNPGDTVLISAMEHHSNIVPWQIICGKRGATLKVIPMNESGELLMDEFERLLDDHVKIVAVTMVSNSLGTVNPVAEIIKIAHAKNIPVLLDAAQAVQHTKVDVQDLDCDFLVFSGHKMYGPTGIGVLYGKEEWLNKLPPYQGGGDMIKSVTFEVTEYNDLPFKFEAGTPNIEAAITLNTAIDFINEIGLENIERFERELYQYALKQLSFIQGVRIIGTAAHRSGAISLVVDGAHSYDIGVLLDKMGIAVRTGHHCTQPVMDFFEIPGTLRISFAVYNTKEEIDVFITSLKRALTILI